MNPNRGSIFPSLPSSSLSMNEYIPMQSEIPKPSKNDTISPWKKHTESKAYFMKDLIFFYMYLTHHPIWKVPSFNPRMHWHWIFYWHLQLPLLRTLIVNEQLQNTGFNHTGKKFFIVHVHFQLDLGDNLHQTPSIKSALGGFDLL